MCRLKHVMCLLLVTLMMFGATGCVMVNITSSNMTLIGEGEWDKKEFLVGKYDSLVVDTDLEVVFSEGRPDCIEFEAPGNLIEHLVLTVENKVLRVSSEHRFSYLDGKPAKLYIHQPVIKEIELSGEVSMAAAAPFSGEKVYLGITGDASGNIMLDCDQLNLRVSGDTNITFSGKADSLDVDFSGAGNLNLSDFLVKKATVRVAGVGEVKVNSADELDVLVSGVGVVSYVGDPEVKQTINGQGAVTKVKSEKN